MEPAGSVATQQWMTAPETRDVLAALGLIFLPVVMIAVQPDLGTSILMLFVFHGFALGLYGELTRPQLYIVMLVAWAIMLAWSKAWLSVYRYGPLEWLWRCLTYGKLFPIRRTREAG